MCVSYVPLAGFEPATSQLEAECAIRLRQRGMVGTALCDHALAFVYPTTRWRDCAATTKRMQCALDGMYTVFHVFFLQ